MFWLTGSCSIRIQAMEEPVVAQFESRPTRSLIVHGLADKPASIAGVTLKV